MDIRADEIAAGIFRVSVFLPEGAGGAGFTFNHFLIVGEEPLVFHCGKRKMFPSISGSSLLTDCAGSVSGTSRPTNVVR
jgi:hypothetical protein